MDLRSPIVTDIDRAWAVEKRPKGWRGSVADWADFVADQAERFERYFADDRKTFAEWSGLWRRVWWPKADPKISRPRQAPYVPHRFAKRGDAAWPKALALATPTERMVAERCGVMLFAVDDPRAKGLAGLRASVPQASVRSGAIDEGEIVDNGQWPDA